MNIPTEHLPAVVTALRTDGVAYLNVGAVAHSAKGWGQTGTLKPPAEWRVLADATCETCDGKGWLVCPYCGESCSVDCPNCPLPGKPIHTLTVECEWCVGDGWLLGEPDHYERGSDAYIACECNPNEDDPFTSPGVSVDVVVAELVPVVPYDSPCTDTKHIVVSPDGAAHLHLSLIRGHQITLLGPPLTPGDWVVRLDVAA